jgi:hypothetical protein
MRASILAFVGAVAAGVAANAAVTPAAAQLQLTPQETRRTPQSAPTQGRPAPRRGGGDAQGARREGAEGQQRGRRRGAPAAPPAEAEPAATNFPRRLDQRALRDRFFDGRPINARALGGALFVITFHVDGRMERVDARGQATNGRWRFQGDAYCSRWEGNRTETCHTVVQEGEVVRVVRNTRAVATWARGGPAPPL